MPESTDYLPNHPSGWHKYYPVTRNRTLSQEREFYFPPDMLPSTKFGVVNEYANTTIWLDKYEIGYTLAVSTTPMIASMVASGTATIPVGLYMCLSRKESWSVVGGNKLIRLAMQSPRFGFSIGSVFKHQAYVKMDVFGVGVTGPAYEIIWLQVAGIPKIEFTSNCRMEKFVVKHGIVVDEKRYVDASDPEKPKKKIKVKLFDNKSSSFFYGTPSGSVTFYGQRAGGFKEFKETFSGIDEDWYAIFDESESLAGEEAKPTPARGDFYVLDSPIMCSDPQMMHQFNLDLDKDGMYTTDEQRYSIDTIVVGIWIYDDKKKLQVAYVDKDQQLRVHLPTSEIQETISGESMEFGGELKDGIALWSSQTPSPSTVRLITEARGGNPTQNFFAGNLVGEYVKFGDHYYEVVDHPRLDTVEVSNVSASSDKTLLKAAPKEGDDEEDGGEFDPNITLLQQNFWKITEVYTSYSAKPEAGALWGGEITGIEEDEYENSYVVKWEASEPRNSLFLPQDEVARTGFKTLPERFRNVFQMKKSAPIDGFDPYGGWRVVIKGVEFKVRGIKITETPATSETSDLQVSIEATVDGDPGAYASAGSSAYMVFGETFKSPFGTSPESNPSVIISTDVARGTNETSSSSVTQPTLYMYGHYNAGFYALPLSLDVKKRLSIANHSYGVDKTDYALGVPRVWVTTYAGTTGVCFLQHGTNGQQTILYKDPELGIVVAVNSEPGWIENRQKSAIRCGISPKTPTEDGIPYGSYMLTGMHGSITPSPKTDSSKKGFFMLVPATGSSSPYHSVRITGYGGIETPLSRKYGVRIQTTEEHPLDLPLEIYEPTFAEEGDINIGSPVVAKASDLILSNCGFDEVDNGDRFEQLSAGQQLPLITPTKLATHFEFTKLRQVLSGVKQFNAHMEGNGNILIFYGKDVPRFEFDSAGSETNDSKPSVFAVKSGTNIDNWGSPKFDRMALSPNDTEGMAEWERPMMLAYDFEFVGSVQQSSGEFLLFGYGYARDDEGNEQDGKRSHMFLGCYRLSSAGMRVGRTDKCYLSMSGVKPENKEELSQFYYRQNHATSTSEEFSMKFGKPLDGLPQKTEGKEDPAEACTERFTRIVGGSQSKAIISWDLSQEIVGIEAADYGMISVFFRDPASNRILKAVSCGSAGTWEVEVDKPSSGDPTPIAYADGSSPTIFNGLLFYFFGDNLYCKNLATVSEGVFKDKQEQLNKLHAGLVAADVVGHKIAVNVDPSGRVVAFYLNKSGYVEAAGSDTSGMTWQRLHNW